MVRIVRVIETERLILRRLTADDAEFILALVNEPAWLRFIGDRGVRTVDDARAYIVEGPIASYERHGFGHLALELKTTGGPIGIGGLRKRDGLDDVDLGVALLPRHWGQGYAREAAAAVIEHATRVLGLARIVAVTSPDNQASIRLLDALGMRLEGRVILPGESSSLLLYALGC